MAEDPRRRWAMFSGMTRREQNVLIFLIVVIGAGLAWQQYQGGWQRDPLTLHRAGEQGAAAPPSSDLSDLSDKSDASRSAPAQFRRPTATTATLDGLLDINAASATQLEILPGIGEVRANAIVQHRGLHGPFHRLDDLKQVPGFGDRTLEAIRPYLKPIAGPSPTPGATPMPPSPTLPPTLDPALSEPPPKININTATMDELAVLEGIGEILAKRIVEYRRKYGPFRSAADIQRVQGIGKIIYARNRDRIVVGNEGKR